MNEEATDESTPTGKALGNVAAVALGIGTTAGLLFGAAAATKGIGKMVRKSAKRKGTNSPKIDRIVKKMNKDDPNGSQDVIDKTKMILNNKPVKEGKNYSKRRIKKATEQAQNDIVGERAYVKSLKEMQQEAESAKPKPKADVDVTESLDEFDDDDGLVNPMMKNIINQANGGEEVSTKPPVTENTTTTKPPVVENTQTTNTPKNNESASEATQPIFDESNMNGSPMREVENLTSSPEGGWNINNKEDYINLPNTDFTSAPEGGWNATYNKTPEAPEIQETVEPLKKKHKKEKKKEKMAENKRRKEERRNK